MQYVITKKYELLLKALEDEVVEALAKRLQVSPDEADFMTPPIGCWIRGEEFAGPGDYDEKDTPNLDKMVDLGLLEKIT